MKRPALMPTAVPAKLLPHITAEWCSVEDAVIRAAYHHPAMLDTNDHALTEAVRRLRALKYIETDDSPWTVRLTAAGEAALDEMHVTNPLPVSPATHARAYIVHALRLRGHKVTGYRDAEAQGMVRHSDWLKVLSMFEDWTKNPQRSTI